MSGISGTSGLSGVSGFSGFSGTSGSSGFSGFSGFSGATGTGIQEERIEFTYSSLGASSPSGFNNGRLHGLSFDPSTDNASDFAFEIPDDLDETRDIQVNIVYHGATATSGNVRLVLTYDVVSEGGDTTPASPTGTLATTLAMPGMAETKQETNFTVPATDFSATTQSLRFTLMRDADAAADTYAGEFRVESISIRYTGFGAPAEQSGTSGASGFSGFSGFSGASLFDSSADTVDVTNTTAETTIYSTTLPASGLVAERVLRHTMTGDFLKNTAGTCTIRWKLGTTTIFTYTISVANDPSRLGLALECVIEAKNSATSQVAGASLVLSAAGSATGTMMDKTVDVAGTNNAISEDMSVSKQFSVTAQWSAASTDLSTRKLAAFLELL
jgi:hypothetical protein